MSRRSTLRRLGIVAAATLALGAAPLVAHAAADRGEDARRAVLDLAGALDRTTTVQAASVPAEATGIGPGSHLLIEREDGLFGCTASWVFEEGGRLLLGAAGHCFLPETATATHGPGADFDPADAAVRVCVSECTFGGQLGFLVEGTTVPLGPIAYARQQQGPGGEQIGWDFGVVEIPADLHDLVRTDMPVFGGPTGAGELASGDQVCHYGAGTVVGEVWPTMGRTGVGLLAEDDAWFAATPAAPGDSGAALQTCAPGAEVLEGVAAIGTLTHLSSLGVAGTTNARSLQLAADDAGLLLSLVLDPIDLAGGGGGGGGTGDGGDTGGDGKGGKGGKGGGRPDHAGGKGRPST